MLGGCRNLRPKSIRLLEVVAEDLLWGSVAEALAQPVGGHAIDAWLVQFQEEHGAFTEDELRSIAADAGIAYLPPPDAVAVADEVASRSSTRRSGRSAGTS